MTRLLRWTMRRAPMAALLPIPLLLGMPSPWLDLPAPVSATAGTGVFAGLA